MFKWIADRIADYFTEDVKGLEDIKQLIVYDETSRLYTKKFESSDVDINALIDSRSKTFVIVIKNKKKEKICEK